MSGTELALSRYLAEIDDQMLRRPAEPTLHDLYQYGFGPLELPASQLLAEGRAVLVDAVLGKDTVLL